eukprot:3060941-Pyramimonas_sp.AAC.1
MRLVRGPLGPYSPLAFSPAAATSPSRHDRMLSWGLLGSTLSRAWPGAFGGHPEPCSTMAGRVGAVLRPLGQDWALAVNHQPTLPPGERVAH